MMPAPKIRRFLGLALSLPVLSALACVQTEPEEPRPAVVPVATELVESALFRGALDLLGRIAPHERLPIQVLETGKVRFPPRFRGGLRLGAEVAAGELLFEIENREIELALASAELEQRAAGLELERARRGVDAGFMAQIDLQRAELAEQLASQKKEQARERMERLQVTAPAAGRLHLEERITDGTEVARGDVLGTIAGRGALRVEGFAAAGDLPFLEPGLEVECRLPGETETIARARLDEVGREVDSRGAVAVRVTVTEDLGLPAAGEGIDLRVLLPERADAISVPLEAVIESGGISSVLVLEPSGAWLRASRRTVRLGRRNDARVEVLDGLRAGERIAVGGVAFLTDGSLATDAGSSDDAR